LYTPLHVLLIDRQDEEWTEEEQQNQGFKQEEFAFLSEMLGPRGVNFDNDDILEETDDEDLRNDAISQIDMQVGVAGLTTTLMCLTGFSGTSGVILQRMCITQCQ
jgi:hypothetical protein